MKMGRNSSIDDSVPLDVHSRKKLLTDKKLFSKVLLSFLLSFRGAGWPNGKASES